LQQHRHENQMRVTVVDDDMQRKLYFLLFIYLLLFNLKPWK